MEERRKMLVGIMQEGNKEVISELMAVASFSPDFKDRNPAAFQRYKDVKLQNDPTSYLAIMQVLLRSFDTSVDLGRVECPVLIIAGDSDSFMEVSVAESMKKAMRNAALQVLPTGHAAAIEAPAEFNQAVLGFVRGLR
jgi:pimeloyl-ACP methyl ester carboxylesterase